MMEQPPDPGAGPFADLLGARRTEMAGGRARFELDATTAHLNPHGTVHGAVVYALADYAMGGALTSVLAPGERCATLDVQIRYLAPVTGGRVVAEARVLSRSGRVGVLEARVFAVGGGDADRLVALATGSFYIQVGRG